MKMKKIHDISRKITGDTAVWPGDGNAVFRKNSSFEKGDGINITSVKMGLHTGTHVDAPLHYIEHGKSLDKMDLSCFIGRAKVFELASKNLIFLEDIRSLDIEKDDIVLFKTANSGIGDEEAFCEDYVALSLEAAGYLAQKKIKTVGIDYLSIEEFFSEDKAVHKLLLGEGIAVIEGLNLCGVGPGEYFLSCLPLKIMEVEASPVRAVLIEK